MYLPSSPVSTSSSADARTPGCQDGVNLWEVWLEMIRIGRLASVLLYVSLHLTSRPVL